MYSCRSSLHIPLRVRLLGGEWAEARDWVSQSSDRNYHPGVKQKLDPTVAQTNKRLLPFLPAQDGTLPHRPDHATPRCLVLVVPRLASTFLRTARSGNASKRLSRRLSWRNQEAPGGETVPRSADGRCSQAAYISRYNRAGRTAGPLVAEDGEGAASEASEWGRGAARTVKGGGREVLGGVGERRFPSVTP